MFIANPLIKQFLFDIPDGLLKRGYFTLGSGIFKYWYEIPNEKEYIKSAHDDFWMTAAPSSIFKPLDDWPLESIFHRWALTNTGAAVLEAKHAQLQGPEAATGNTAPYLLLPSIRIFFLKAILHHNLVFGQNSLDSKSSKVVTSTLVELCKKTLPVYQFWLKQKVPEHAIPIVQDFQKEVASGIIQKVFTCKKFDSATGATVSILKDLAEDVSDLTSISEPTSEPALAAIGQAHGNFTLLDFEQGEVPPSKQQVLSVDSLLGWDQFFKEKETNNPISESLYDICDIEGGILQFQSQQTRFCVMCFSYEVHPINSKGDAFVLKPCGVQHLSYAWGSDTLSMVQSWFKQYVSNHKNAWEKNLNFGSKKIVGYYWTVGVLDNNTCTITYLDEVSCLFVPLLKNTPKIFINGPKAVDASALNAALKNKNLEALEKLAKEAEIKFKKLNPAKTPQTF